VVTATEVIFPLARSRTRYVAEDSVIASSSGVRIPEVFGNDITEPSVGSVSMRHSAGMEAARAAFFCAATDFQSDVILHDKNNPQLIKSPTEGTGRREDITSGITQLSGLPRPEQTPTQTQRHRRWGTRSSDKESRRPANVRILDAPITCDGGAVYRGLISSHYQSCRCWMVDVDLAVDQFLSVT
jgi:hypothetical protein